MTERFERLAILGAGATTVTEKAFLVGSAQTVTLVRLLPHAEENDEVRAVFVEKGKLLARLPDLGVAETLELGRSRTHYLARQFVEGLSLRALLGAASKEGAMLPASFACDVAVHIGLTLVRLRARLGRFAPRFLHCSFADTLRSLVFSAADGCVHWVDPLGLDNMALPSVDEKPEVTETAGLAALLYELCTAIPAPLACEVQEFETVAPSCYNTSVPKAIDALCARAFGFAPVRPFCRTEELIAAIAASASSPSVPDSASPQVVAPSGRAFARRLSGA